MFTGDFSAWPTPIYDPNNLASDGTKLQFLGNKIPSSRLDPISQKFLKYYVSSNLPGFSSNYVQTNSFSNNRQGFTARMDFVESSKSQWTGRFSWGDEDQSSTGISITGSKIITNYKQYLATNTRTITPALVNEARFGYTTLSNALGTRSAYDQDTVSALGIPSLAPGDLVAWGVTMASFAGDGFVAIGDAQDGPYWINDNTTQLVDNVSWTCGKHSFRFGFEYTRQNFNQIGNQFSRGQFAFQPNATQSSSKTGGDAFTWAKSIDTTSGIRNQGNDTLYPQNMYCLACERGLSAFDTKHRMVTSILYDLPVGKGKRLGISNPVVNTIFGGWNLGGILTLQSGMPGNLGIGGVDNASTGSGGYDRPNSTGISPYLDNPTPSRYWNLDAYVEAPPGQFGNVGRLSIRGPGIIQFDAEIHKQFRMPYKEGHSLQFRFEAFNIPNHPNWGMPNTNILAGAARSGYPSTAARQNFGVVTSTSTSMRQIQFGLKYMF